MVTCPPASWPTSQPSWRSPRSSWTRAPAQDMAAGNGTIRARNRTARWLTEVFQPPVVVSIQLLISPLAEPGFPGTIGFGALAALFVCVLPLIVLLVLVRLGKVTDHHVSDRRQRAPVLLMSLACIAVGLLVLAAAGAPHS